MKSCSNNLEFVIYSRNDSYEADSVVRVADVTIIIYNSYMNTWDMKLSYFWHSCRDKNSKTIETFVCSGQLFMQITLFII